MHSVETKPDRSIEDVGKRITLQKELLEQCINDQLVAATDLEAMKKIFAKVSDIIDSNDAAHHSIMDAYNSGDNHAAAMMIKTIIFPE